LNNLAKDKDFGFDNEESENPSQFKSTVSINTSKTVMLPKFVNPKLPRGNEETKVESEPTVVIEKKAVNVMRMKRSVVEDAQ
jgi:hypothetical protein